MDNEISHEESITIYSFLPESKPNAFRAPQRDISPESSACAEMQGRNIELARARSVSSIRKNRTQVNLRIADYTEHNARLLAGQITIK